MSTKREPSCWLALRNVRYPTLKVCNLLVRLPSILPIVSTLNPRGGADTGTRGAEPSR